MFTGIIERTVRVSGAADGPGFRRLTIASHWNDVRLGESVAVNGVCLTVAEISSAELGFDVIAETLAKTNLGSLSSGDLVNVERSLRIGDRLDGHFVQGHVDGVGRLVRQDSNEKEWRLRVAAPTELARYLTPKGSITLDGVSLTIAVVEANEFELALIPTTLKLTTLGSRMPGWRFNLECDVLTKTVVSWLERTNASTQTTL